MEKIKKNTFVLIVFSAFAFFNIFADTIPDGISISIKTGNSKELAKHFSDDIELVILDKEGVYSRYQAEQILKNFFSKYQPSSFNVVHEGGKDGSNYAIGNLNTAQGEFRVYFLMKAKGSQLFIHQLRIEKKDAN